MKKWLLLALVWPMLASTPVGLASDTDTGSPFPTLLSGIRLSDPLDFCGEPVPLHDQDVRERLEKEMLLSLWDRAQVILWIKRSGRFFPVIEKQLAANGLPDDLKYVPVVESALRAHAGSVKGAIGFWQFMRATGRKYGLTVNRSIDQRRNIFTATEAAIRFFKKLYAMTGSWALSAAAYNMGEQGLMAAVKAQQVNDYYRLHLPLETQRYVFKILAVKQILSQPEKYGFHLTEADLYPPLAFDRVTVKNKRPTSVLTVATAAGTYYKKIKDLNPQIRGQMLPRGRHVLLVPSGAGDRFQEKLKTALQEASGHPTVYVVRTGDSLSTIAKRHNVSLKSLVLWNRIDVSDPIHPGDRLMIYR